MTDLTDEAVKSLLDGATPGPWRADGEPWNRIVWSSADNRVCFMAHSSGLNDARDTATSNLVAAAPDLARALLDARAELAAAQALMVERAADACVDLAAQVSNAALTGLPEQARLRESMEAAFTKASHVIRALAPADGLAAVEALRVEARENAMQALASMGQAQEAYEAQLEAEAELARVKADAQAAVALAIERAAEACDDLAIGYAKHKGVPGALHDAARDIRALALDAGTAELARLRDRERVLADFIAEFAAAKIDALRYQPAYGESPEDEPDPVVDAKTVWAWQADAKAALATLEAGNG